ncbi:MAG: TonB-dependent receptor [Planctomycetota bacterium]
MLSLPLGVLPLLCFPAVTPVLAQGEPSEEQQAKPSASVVAATPASEPAASEPAAARAAAPAAAQADDDEVTVMEEVIVEGRGASRLGFSPSSSEGVTGREQLRRRPLLRPGEILETTPGVIITQHSGSGKGNQFFLRGFNLDHGTDFLVTVDRVPINLRSHGHGQGYVDLNFLIPELVDTVAYRKGPYFADTGDFSSAGSVSLDYVRNLPNAIAMVEYGAFNFQRAMLADSFKVGRHDDDLLVAVETQHYDGPWEEPENFNKINLLARYATGDAQNGSAYTANAYDGSWTSTDHVARRAVDSGLINRFGTLDPTSGGTSSRYSLTGRWYGTDSDRRWDVSAYAYNYNLDLFSNFTYFLNDQVNGDQFRQIDRRWVQGAHGANTWFGEVFGRPAETRVGGEFRNDIIENGLENTVARRTLSRTRRDDILQTSAAAFADNTTYWTNTVRTNLGIRGDVYHFDVDSDNPSNSGNKTDGIFSPNASIVFGPYRDVEFYVNAGYGFHSNDARGVTLRDDPTTPAPNDGVAVDPLVRQRGAEVGVRYESPGGLKSTLTLWGLESDSELLFIGDAGGSEPSGATERWGVEWTNYWQFTQQLSLDFDVTFSEARFTNAGDEDRVPGAIGTTLAAGLAYETEQGHYAALRARYFGPRDLEETGQVQSSSTMLVNAHFAYRLTENWQARISIFNLLNREASDIEYFYPSRLENEPAGPDDGGFNDVHFHPVEPFAVRVGLTAAF